MRKIWLLYGILFYSALAFAKVTPSHGRNITKGPAVEQELFSLLDMKVFHDRQIMQTVFLELYDQQTAGTSQRDNLTLGIFTEKDSATLENAMDKKQIKYKITPGLMKKADQAPFETFKNLISTAEVPQLTQEEMKDLEKVDRKAISRLLEMMDASGPDIGAGRVSVVYGNETQN